MSALSCDETLTPGVFQLPASPRSPDQLPASLRSPDQPPESLQSPVQLPVSLRSPEDNSSRTESDADLIPPLRLPPPAIGNFYWSVDHRLSGLDEQELVRVYVQFWMHVRRKSEECVELRNAIMCVEGSCECVKCHIGFLPRGFQLDYLLALREAYIFWWRRYFATIWAMHETRAHALLRLRAPTCVRIDGRLVMAQLVPPDEFYDIAYLQFSRCTDPLSVDDVVDCGDSLEQL